MIYTTLNRIREHEPCADGWRKLLKYLGKTEADDAPLAYSTILDAVGLDDALWCLCAEPQHASIWRIYAVRCARRVQHLMTDERSIQALDVAERHARGLANDKLARAISDVGFGMFRSQIEYKAKRYGTRLIIADRWYPSSRLCSACGEKNEALTLKDREWTCPACGTHHDRDHNA